MLRLCEGTNPDDGSEKQKKLFLARHTLDHKIVLETTKKRLAFDFLSMVTAQVGAAPGKGMTVKEFFASLDDQPEIKIMQAAVARYEAEFLACQPELHSDEADVRHKVPEVLKMGVLNEFAAAHVRDRTTLAHRTSICFVNRFLAWADGPAAENRWHKLHDRCDVPHLPAFTTTGSDDVRSFVRLMAVHLAQAYASESQHGVELVELAVEEFIFPNIYQRCMDQVADAAADAQLRAQCQRFAGKVTQSELFIERVFQSAELVPFAAPIALLRTLSGRFTPSTKLIAIYSAAQSVISTLAKQSLNALVIGADDFLPIWIYAVLNADISLLASNIAFIRRFASPDVLQTELGYYFSSLELAAEVVRTLSQDKLCQGVEPSPMAGRPFLMCDRARAASWAAREPHIVMVQPEVVLEGYRLCVVEDWLWDLTRFQALLVFKTGDPRDRIVASVLQASSDLSESQHRFLESCFLNSLPTSKIVTETTDHGSLLLCTHTFERTDGVRGSRRSITPVQEQEVEPPQPSTPPPPPSQPPQQDNKTSNPGFLEQLDMAAAAAAAASSSSSSSSSASRGAPHSPPSGSRHRFVSDPVAAQLNFGSAAAAAAVPSPSRFHLMRADDGHLRRPASVSDECSASGATPPRLSDNLPEIMRLSEVPSGVAKLTREAQQALAVAEAAEASAEAARAAASASSAPAPSSSSPAQFEESDATSTVTSTVTSTLAPASPPRTTSPSPRKQRALEAYFDSLTLLHVPSGNFAECSEAILLQVQLKRVGCTTVAKKLSLACPAEAEAEFTRMYSYLIPVASVPLNTALSNLIKEVQTTLRHLDFYSDMHPLDGCYNDETVAAMRGFQLFFNARHRARGKSSTDKELRVDGFTDMEVLPALRRTLADLRDHLAITGYQSKDPVRFPNPFEATVKAFQAAHGIEPTGRITRATLSSLDEYHNLDTTRKSE